ncbi:MAG TPA: hypothetical protein DCR46_06700 [Cytophagales bacterium]|nr:hypothetical protein [Cytophagales bacterium]
MCYLIAMFFLNFLSMHCFYSFYFKRVKWFLVLLFINSNGGWCQVSKTIAISSETSFGNLNSVNGSLQSSLSHDSSNASWSVSPSFLITMIKREKDYEVFESETFVTSTFTKKFEKWKIIAFMDAENSFLRQTLFRCTAGVGVGTNLLAKGGWKVSVSEVVMPEIYVSDDRSLDEVVCLRLSTRLKIKFKGKVNFESIAFFQPSVWNSNNITLADNINARTTNTLDVPINKKFSLGIQLMMQAFTLPNYLDGTIRVWDSKTSFLIKATF